MLVHAIFGWDFCLHAMCPIYWPLTNRTYIFHCILTLIFISNVKLLIYFPSFISFLNVKEVFNYIVKVVKQSCEQSKHASI